MGLDLGQLAARQAEMANVGNRFKPKKVPNNSRIRVFIFTHKVTQEDVKNGLFTKDKLGKTVDQLDRGVTMQFGLAEKKRPILATAATLAKHDALSKSGKDADKKAAEAIKPSRKYLLNVIDIDEKPRKMRVWACPSTAYNDILALVMSKNFGEAILGCKGRDLELTFDPSKAAAEMYKVMPLDQSKSVILNADLQNKVNDFWTAAGLKEAGLDLEATEEAPSEETEEPAAEEETTEEEPAQEEESTEEETTEESAEESTEEETEEQTEEEQEEEPTEEPPAKPSKKAAPAKKPAPKKGKK